MNVSYLIGVVIFIKLVHSFYKRLNVNDKQIHYQSNAVMDIYDDSNSEADVTNIKSAIEIPSEIPEEVPKSLGKNKWLNPTDDFGKMEKGRAL